MKKAKLVCAGTGLVALDMLLAGDSHTPVYYSAGGSCGNVLTILSFMGWDSYPIARLARNPATAQVMTDLSRWHVRKALISITNDGCTPVIIHRVLRDRHGNTRHRFEFRDPVTKARLPGYKPVLSSKVAQIIGALPNAPRVFYFDRANRGSIDLAKSYSLLGALIIFEPSSIGDGRLFSEAAEVSHVIKFSNERIPNYQNLYKEQLAPLEIRTLGKDGMEFRFGKQKRGTKWHYVPAVAIDELIDAAGAGDWLSASLINLLGKGGKAAFLKRKFASIRQTLFQSRYLPALNCFFMGARGVMYGLKKQEIEDIVATWQGSSVLKRSAVLKKTAPTLKAKLD